MIKTFIQPMRKCIEKHKALRVVSSDVLDVELVCDKCGNQFGMSRDIYNYVFCNGRFPL